MTVLAAAVSTPDTTALLGVAWAAWMAFLWAVTFGGLGAFILEARALSRKRRITAKNVAQSVCSFALGTLTSGMIGFLAAEIAPGRVTESPQLAGVLAGTLVLSGVAPSRAFLLRGLERLLGVKIEDAKGENDGA